MAKPTVEFFIVEDWGNPTLGKGPTDWPISFG
jgi:hypothetical protein